jgi:peptide/nickel transport system permease protein
MAVAELTTAGGALAAPRRRRTRAAASRIAGGLAVLITILLLSSFITYSLGALSNSNPAATILGQDAATPAAVAHLDHVLGLDKPLPVQYGNWLSQAVRGNLGVSYFTQIPVSQSIAQRLPVDLSIAIGAIILAVLIGGTAGTVAAVRRGGWVDRGVTLACSAVSTLPAFVVGIILVVAFAVGAHVLPANGYTGRARGSARGWRTSCCRAWRWPCRSPRMSPGSCEPRWSPCSSRTTSPAPGSGACRTAGS